MYVSGVTTEEAVRLRTRIQVLLLRTLRRKVWRPTIVIALGAGSTVYTDEYAGLRDEGVRTVIAFDPAIKLYRGGHTRVDVRAMTRLDDVPIGHPAIAAHPGFWMTPREHGYTRAKPGSWDETIEHLRPPAIAWCSYAREDFDGDMEFLAAHGYKKIHEESPEETRAWPPMGVVGSRFCSVIGLATRMGTSALPS